MITQPQDEEIAAWFSGRLPADWVERAPEVTVDREEVTVRVALDPVELDEGASDEAWSAAAQGRISGWREDTRDTRMRIAQEAEQRFERKVSWGASIGNHTTLFTHLAVPTMTRLQQSERQVLDTLVDAGVARSRSEALAWCVKLVGTHSEQWLHDLRTALEQVHAVREHGPS
ncbi:MAG: hypothetical protein ACRDQA_01920 [Nocardioidaceae bacterium]